MVTTEILDDIKVIDTDTHVIEPYDLWTSRISTKKWGDLVPHVEWDEKAQEDAWYFGSTRIGSATNYAVAGSELYPPDHKPTLKECEPETWDGAERLRWMDRHGIYAQILYPNVAGFGTGRFLALNDPELMLACCRSYNDFLTDFASIAPDRFIAVSALPFWDLEATISEMQRCAAMGHRGVIFARETDYFGLPHLTHPHWDPFWAAAQDMELSINFHIAAGDRDELERSWEGMGRHARVSRSVMSFILGNAMGLADLIHAGIPHRYPTLNFVSVESGIGWIPYALHAMDWHWKNMGVHIEHPEYLLPSDYFKRQFYGCFWFEDVTALQAIDILGPDNFLFETDFPHSAGLAPGPASMAVSPREHIVANFSGLPESSLRKILHDNAAKLYHLNS
jgi:predicted TIM-barrel fold metal-dependent hydrolase